MQPTVKCLPGQEAVDVRRRGRWRKRTLHRSYLSVHIIFQVFLLLQLPPLLPLYIFPPISFNLLASFLLQPSAHLLSPPSNIPCCLLAFLPPLSVPSVPSADWRQLHTTLKRGWARSSVTGFSGVRRCFSPHATHVSVENTCFFSCCVSLWLSAEVKLGVNGQ